MQDILVISDALRSANVFARLAISPDIEPHVARIAGVRRFPAKGGVVAREGHAAESFYAVLEGCLFVQDPNAALDAGAIGHAAAAPDPEEDDFFAARVPRARLASTARPRHTRTHPSLPSRVPRCSGGAGAVLRPGST